MKKTLLTLALGFLVISGVQAQTYVSENFNSTSGSSLPTGWTSASGTWKTGAPNSIVPNAASKVGINLAFPGHEKIVGINGDKANDNSILVTPKFDIPSSVTDAYVTFDQTYFKVRMSNNQSLIETLTLMYTTDGQNWTDIVELTANTKYTWENRGISLANLAGKNDIQLGFKYQNVSTDLVGAAFDNIMVHVPGASEMGLSLATPQQGSSDAYGAVNSTKKINGLVQNNGTQAITSYTVYYQEGNNAPVSTPQSGNIPAFSMGTFAVNYTIPSVGEHPIKVWVELSGDSYAANDSGLAFFEGAAFSPTKRLVMEEGTGTWCGWCPRGSHMMRVFFQNNHGKAAQIAVHNNDPMMVADYNSTLAFSSFPKMRVDRTYEGDPGSIQDLYTQYKNNFGFAEVTMGDPNVTSNKVTVSATIKPAVNIPGAKVALIVTEDNVTGQGGKWPQQNYYAGGGSGAMGGYESKPSVINDEVYDFVGRAIAPSATGGTMGLPNVLEVGKTYNVDLSANLGQDWKEEDMRFVVILLNSNGQILNSDFTGSEGGNQGIKNVVSNLSNVSIFPNPANEGFAFVKVNAKESTNGQITIADVTGRIVKTIPSVQLNKGANQIKIATDNLANGSYMVTVMSDNGTTSAKLQIVK